MGTCTYSGVGNWEFTSLREKGGDDPSKKALRDYWGKPPDPNNKREKKYKRNTANESPGKGHTGRYEVDDERDDGERRGT